MAGISKSTQAKLDKLARERPDLLEQVQAGLSANQAVMLARSTADTAAP